MKNVQVHPIAAVIGQVSFTLGSVNTGLEKHRDRGRAIIETMIKVREYGGSGLLFVKRYSSNGYNHYFVFRLQEQQ